MASNWNYLARFLRWADRHIQRSRAVSAYNRYRDATMIQECAFVENLELARRIAADSSFARCSVVECGTWRGGMSAALIEVMGRERSYHFFDSFAGLPPAKAIDGEAARRWQENTNSPYNYNNCTASQEEFIATINRTGIDHDKVHVYPGLFQNTVGTIDVGRIALLRLDGDWYDSTMCCLRAFFPRMADGGYVIIDDYGFWDGCTRAVHDYLARNERTESIYRHGLSNVPYIKVCNNNASANLRA